LGVFVGFKPAPAEGVDNIFFRAGYKAVLIGVFDPEDEVAAVTAGK